MHRARPELVIEHIGSTAVPGLPGKGIVDWPAMLGLLKKKGYTGFLSYEAPNPELWARPPVEVAREGVELTKKLLAELPN